MTVPLVSNFVDPESIISQISIAYGATVVDFGCGSGFFSLAFAKAVGQEGRVIALDILPSALEAVASRAKIAGLSQLSVKRANLERENGTGLADESTDWVIMKDILFQNKRKDILLKEAYRITRVGGQLLLMEWKKESNSPLGPELHLRMSKEDLLQLVQDAGFTVKKELSVGDFHYAFLLGK